MIVLDTNVISELMKPEPERSVYNWLRKQRRADLFTTAICRAEIMVGIGLRAAGRSRNAFAESASRIFREFEGKILPFDSVAADELAVIVPLRQRLGRRMNPFDAQIAAIARARGAALATRNVGDFADCGIELIDPWHV